MMDARALATSQAPVGSTLYVAVFGSSSNFTPKKVCFWLVHGCMVGSVGWVVGWVVGLVHAEQWQGSLIIVVRLWRGVCVPQRATTCSVCKVRWWSSVLVHPCMAPYERRTVHAVG
jgi:hypothetical protein